LNYRLIIRHKKRGVLSPLFISNENIY